jgi:hypothetical protein
LTAEELGREPADKMDWELAFQEMEARMESDAIKKAQREGSRGH